MSVSPHPETEGSNIHLGVPVTTPASHKDLVGDEMTSSDFWPDFPMSTPSETDQLLFNDTSFDTMTPTLPSVEGTGSAFEPVGAAGNSPDWLSNTSPGPIRNSEVLPWNLYALDPFLVNLPGVNPLIPSKCTSFEIVDPSEATSLIDTTYSTPVTTEDPPPRREPLPLEQADQMSRGSYSCPHPMCPRIFLRKCDLT
jgi:hypothetical protein